MLFGAIFYRILFGSIFSFLLLACASTGKNSSSSPPIASADNQELDDATNLYNYEQPDDLSYNLFLTINHDIKIGKYSAFQKDKWIPIEYVLREQDYCTLGGSGLDINEKSGARDYIVFIKSIPDDAKSIRIGMPGMEITSFVFVECNLASIAKEDFTYGHLKTLTRNMFKLTRSRT